MGEKTKKDLETTEKVKPEPLDDEDLEKIGGGSAPYGNAPDGTPWKPQ